MSLFGLKPFPPLKVAETNVWKQMFGNKGELRVTARDLALVHVKPVSERPPDTVPSGQS